MNESEFFISPRPDALRGKRLESLDNTKANAGVILRKLIDILNAKFECSAIYYAKKHSFNLPPKPDILSDLHCNSDVIIAGVGD